MNLMSLLAALALATLFVAVVAVTFRTVRHDGYGHREPPRSHPGPLDEVPFRLL